MLTVDMALPGAPPQAGPLMKMTIQIWTATPEETQRVPALQEIRSYTAMSTASMNPAGMIKQLLSGLPEAGDKLGSMIEELSKKQAMALRAHMELSIPMLAVMIQQMPPQTGPTIPAGFDPNAPMIQMTQELVELSTAALDDSIFEVPTDYLPVSMEEVLKGAASAPPPPQFKQ